MIRSSLFSLAICLGSTSLFGQLGEVQFGIQLSPTFSYMGTNNSLINGDGTNLGLKLGVIAEYYFQENYSFHTGIGLHFNSGGTLFYEDQFTDVDIWNESLENFLPAGSVPTPDQLSGRSFKYDMQFVEIPLGLTLRTREFGYMRYFVRPSLHLGILTNSKGSIKNLTGIDPDESFDISKETNSLNLGWGLGAGVEYAVSTNTSLIGGIGIQSGFADLTSDKGTQLTRTGRQPQEDDSKGKVNAIVITLGVMF